MYKEKEELRKQVTDFKTPVKKNVSRVVEFELNLERSPNVFENNRIDDVSLVLRKMSRRVLLKFLQS